MKDKELKQAKFKVGDVVTHKPNLDNETEGVIVEVERLFKKVTYFGEDEWMFEEHGLCTRESDIASIQIPKEFDGQTLKVTYPKGTIASFDKTEYSKPFTWSYTVRSKTGFLMIISERFLKPKK